MNITTNSLLRRLGKVLTEIKYKYTSCDISAFLGNYTFKYKDYCAITLKSYGVTYPPYVHNFVDFIILVWNIISNDARYWSMSEYLIITQAWMHRKRKIYMQFIALFFYGLFLKQFLQGNSMAKTVFIKLKKWFVIETKLIYPQTKVGQFYK